MLIMFIVSGYKEGFLLKLLGILSFFVIGCLSWWMSSFIASYISLFPQHISWLKGTPFDSLVYNDMNRMIIFVVLFFIFNILILLLRPVVKVIGSIPIVSTFNHIAGCVLGGIQAILVLVLISTFLRFPFWEKGPALVDKSWLRYSYPVAQTVLFYAKEPMEQLKSLTTALQKKDALNAQDFENIRAWMQKANIDKEKADEYISMLKR